MDPAETLHLADLAIMDARYVDALEHLDNYADWRRRGGFEPHIASVRMGGDDFADKCARRVKRLAR